jgi:iron complex outermembrane receptor protein
VASFTTLDLYAAYQLDKSWKIHGSLNNAFDRLPPLDLQTYGGSNYNPSMHQAGAVGRLLTVGATYNF